MKKICNAWFVVSVLALLCAIVSLFNPHFSEKVVHQTDVIKVPYVGWNAFYGSDGIYVEQGCTGKKNFIRETLIAVCSPGADFERYSYCGDGPIMRRGIQNFKGEGICLVDYDRYKTVLAWGVQ